MMLLLLATNSVLPEGARIIAEGTKGVLSVVTAVPLAVSAPVPKFTLKLETVPPNCGFVLPWVATKRAPVPDPVELLVEQPIKQSTANETSKAARKPNFIPILSPCVVLKLSQHRATPRSGRPKSIVTFICVSGMPGKSKRAEWLEPA